MSKRTDLEQHLIQENARLRTENRDLLDRIMHMADRSWNVAPVDLLEPDKKPEEEGWVSDPSQVIEEERPPIGVGAAGYTFSED